jgi:putative sterol carrier protein
MRHWRNRHAVLRPARDKYAGAGAVKVGPTGACRDPAVVITRRREKMGVQEIAEQLRPRVESSDFDKSVKFDTGGDGVIVINGATISTTDAPADCTISLSLENLEALIAGDLSPTMAFMTGKIKVDGDMTIAMALSKLL